MVPVVRRSGGGRGGKEVEQRLKSQMKGASAGMNIQGNSVSVDLKMKKKSIASVLQQLLPR